MKTITLVLVLLVILVDTANAFDLNPYHNIVKKLVRNNFKAIEEHRPEEIMSGVSDKSLEHSFAGDNSLSGTRHDKESL